MRKVAFENGHFFTAGGPLFVESTYDELMIFSSGHRNHRVTPSTPRTNPFENYDPSELTMSIISPSVFGISKERSKINGEGPRSLSLTYYQNCHRIPFSHVIA